MDDALRSFDGVLAEKPTNVIALLGKVNVIYFVVSYKPTDNPEGKNLVC